MTIPPYSILPFHGDQIKKGGDDLEKYIKELTSSLQEQYEMLAEAANGDIRSSFDIEGKKFIPTVKGGSAAGVGTYTHGSCWILRKGILIDYWFDIKWSAHTGTGVLTVDLPYLCIESDNNPFICSISADGIIFSGYLSGSVDPGTRDMQIYDNRSGTTFNNIAVPASASIRGHLRYVGKSIERS